MVPQRHGSAWLDEAALEAAGRCIAGLRDAGRARASASSRILMERVRRPRELATQAEPLVPPSWVASSSASWSAGGKRWSWSARPACRRSAAGTRDQRGRGLRHPHRRGRGTRPPAPHLDEIERLLGAGGEVGKRLDFLIQELHREANTLASRAGLAELTNISVEMKVAIEQLREQVQNIE